MEQILTEKLNSRSNNLLPQEIPHGEFFSGELSVILPALSEEYAGKVKLVYLDPPFMTGNEFEASFPVGEKGFRGDRKFFCRVPSYSDKWSDRGDYLAFLRAALTGARALMREDGVICLHVDRHMSAYARLLLDEVFGERCFLNEIIWHYHSGGSSRYSFAAKHDNLFLYGKTPKVKLNPAAVGKKRTAEKHNHMKKSIDQDGRVYFSIKSAGKEYRYYEDEIVTEDDVWEIPHLQQKHPERTGYSTQKPLQLLDRIVRSCSEEGDLVCDLFAGSGTTLVSANSLNRRYLGLDREPVSLQTFRRRLASGGAADLTVHYAVQPADVATVSLDKDCAGGLVRVHLAAYSIMDKGMDIPHYDDGRQYITYWALGRIEDNTFITEDFSVRSSVSPELKDNLSAPEEGEKAVYYCDCIGNQRFIKI